MRKIAAVGEQIPSRRLRPQGFEIFIVDENLGSTGSVRAVFKIVPPAVQQQGSAVCIEKYRRERVVSVGFDELARGCHLQRSGQRIRAKIIVEANESDAR